MSKIVSYLVCLGSFYPKWVGHNVCTVCFCIQKKAFTQKQKRDSGGWTIKEKLSKKGVFEEFNVYKGSLIMGRTQDYDTAKDMIVSFTNKDPIIAITVTTWEVDSKLRKLADLKHAKSIELIH